MGASVRASARTTRTGSRRRVRTSASHRCRPARRATLHVRRRLEPDDVQGLQAQERGLGADQVPVAGPGPDRLREADGHVPGARRAAEGLGESSGATTRPFYEAIQQGRTYAPIPQWAQIENAYKTRFGNILDEAARARPATPTIQKQLDDAAKEADGLLAQSDGLVGPSSRTGGACRRPARPFSSHEHTSPPDRAAPHVQADRRAASAGAAARCSGPGAG